MDTISVVGCGWLGLPLARRMVGRGCTVKGSTTTEDKLQTLRDSGIEPYLLRLTPEPGENPGALLDADVLFVNVPPPRGVDDRAAYHMRQMEALRDTTQAEWVIFASSTGVYPNAPKVVAEADVPPGGPPAVSGSRRPTGDVLQAVEGMWMAAEQDVTILRFGGLYGPDRHPGRFLAGRTGLSRPQAPVNLIHLEDCIGVVEAVLDQNARNDVFNAVAPHHPSRKDAYTHAARTLGLEPPTFDPSDTRTGKMISSEKTQTFLGYTYRHAPGGTAYSTEDGADSSGTG